MYKVLMNKKVYIFRHTDIAKIYFYMINSCKKIKIILVYYDYIAF